MKYVFIALALLSVAHVAEAKHSKLSETITCVQAGIDNGDSKADIAWTCNVDVEDIPDYE